jgi:hypothetical protein
MLKLRLGSIDLLVTLALGLAAAAGCTSEPLKSKGSADGSTTLVGDDGGAPDQVVHDPAACGCSVNGYTLTISWDCFCKDHDCTQGLASQICPPYGQGQWERGCNYQKYSVFTIGGLEWWLYDGGGQLVGVHEATDDGFFTCPTDPTLQGFSLEAGQTFPATCESATTCQCDADAGTCDPTDAGLTLF